MTVSTDHGGNGDNRREAARHGLDRGLSGRWPDEVAKAAAACRLGYVVEGLDLRYVRDPATRLWTSAATEAAIGSLVLAGEEASPRFAVITTQTCDLVDGARDDDHPWFQVSPVLAYPSADKVPKADHLRVLTGNGLPAGVWVADLRLEVPIEKPALVGRRVVHGFETEDEEIDFAHTLGRRRDRAALADTINTCLRRQFTRKLRNNRPRGKRVIAALYAVALALEEGTRLDPRSVEVHFVGAGAEPADDVRAWLGEWWDAANLAATTAERPFRLWNNVYHASECVDLSEWDELIVLEWW